MTQASEVVLEAEECPRCGETAARARRLAARITCDCGAEYQGPQRDPERLLQSLLGAVETMARWAPYFHGSAIDYDRTRLPEQSLTPAEREERDEKNERGRACARELFVKLEALRTEAHRTQGPELVRAVAVIDWLIERGGPERTKGHRVGGEVVAPKLSRLVGEAFADALTRQLARATPRPGSEGYVIVRAAAERAKTAIEEHGAELLRDAAWLWSAAESCATAEATKSFGEICSALTARVKAVQERRAKEAALMRSEGER